jgi:hypothetical protein
MRAPRKAQKRCKIGFKACQEDRWAGELGWSRKTGTGKIEQERSNRKPGTGNNKKRGRNELRKVGLFVLVLARGSCLACPWQEGEHWLREGFCHKRGVDYCIQSV